MNKIDPVMNQEDKTKEQIRTGLICLLFYILRVILIEWMLFVEF